MSERNPDYLFVSADSDAILTGLTEAYEIITGRTVLAASPEKLFLAWIASGMQLIYNNINYAANQNVPSRAQGENLDALAELFFMRSRPEAAPAYVTMEFTISAAQNTTIVIPAGTRVTTMDGNPVFETTEDATITIGDLSTQVQAVCQTTGAIGNGYTAGQISECVDLFPFFESCSNVDTSAGGSDAPDDDEFYELLKSSEDAWSSAGPRGAYKYFAKTVSDQIADVIVNSPSPGEVRIYALMEDGTPAGSTIKNLIQAACDDDNVRPLTDIVSVADPSITTYNITATYYYSTESEMSAADIEANVQAAVQDYITWQAGKLGRDINPSKLIQMIVSAGAKRVELTSPTFMQLNDGSDNNAPGLAQVGTVTLTNGGPEDE